MSCQKTWPSDLAKDLKLVLMSPKRRNWGSVYLAAVGDVWDIFGDGSPEKVRRLAGVLKPTHRWPVAHWPKWPMMRVEEASTDQLSSPLAAFGERPIWVWLKIKQGGLRGF